MSGTACISQWANSFHSKVTLSFTFPHVVRTGIVSDPKKGVCADPVDRGAILGRGEPDPHSRDRARQLAPDKGSGKT
jgi:hypothetical protein